ncbi:hypothetical protein GCM10029964_092740 [Kibdelosporangium lantanae]
MIRPMPAVDLPAPEPPEAQDIVALVGQHTTLRSLGDKRWQGACPFCESTAFQVRRKHGTFHCFHCGEGGDAVRFLAKVNLR